MTVRNRDERSRYQLALPEILKRGVYYDSLGDREMFRASRGKDFGVPGLDSSAMINLYDQRFARNRGTTSQREQLRNSSPLGLCPYCGQGSVAQLDHYLPKGSCAAVAVHPPNLVPCCRDCNSAKLTYMPAVDKAPVLHPYFDTCFSVPWLTAEIVFPNATTPLASFSALPPAAHAGLQERLDTHLTVFNLRSRFSVWAAQVLDNLTRLTASHSYTFTQSSMREHLLLEAEAHSGGRINTWERATYQAIARSDQFLIEHLGLSV